MGRSVSTPTDCTSVCYRDISGFGYGVTEGGEIDYEGGFDQEVQQEEWEDFVCWIRETAKSKWKSLYDCDTWLDREDHAILENDFAYIGISEYCGLCSVWLKSKSEKLLCTGYSDDEAKANLADNWCELISANFDKAFEQLCKVGTASNGESFYRKVAA